MYFYNARWYDPYLNHFTQPDSIVPDPANPQAWDRYTYSLNNPIKYVDPSGHDPILIAMLVIAATSFIISACASETPTPRQAEIQSLIDNQDYQGAIDKAIELYDIDTHGVQPEYDSTLKTDIPDTVIPGETTYSGYEVIDGVLVGGTAEVAIGPDAFSSPDTLVGTLVHESVHIEQWQTGRKYASNEGYWLNEVEAYDYVADHKDEFELSKNFLEGNDFYRDVYYRLLPSSLRDRVRNKIYTLPK